MASSACPMETMSRPIHPTSGKVNSAKSKSMILHNPVLWASRARLALIEPRELLAENYGKDLANSNRSRLLSESRARNLSSPEFVVWQQYGGRRRS
jgi:hypothetical protein